MASGQEILPIQIEGEVEIFLKILIELVIKEPKEYLIKKQNDKTDGPTLDAIILGVAKLTDLLKKDIDSLNIPSLLKTALKILRNFLNFISQTKKLYALKHGKNKKHTNKKRKTDKECSENVSSNQ